MHWLDTKRGMALSGSVRHERSGVLVSGAMGLRSCDLRQNTPTTAPIVESDTLGIASFSNAITVTELDNYLSLDPGQARSILLKLQKSVSEKTFEGYPILLVPSNVRLHLRRFLEHVLGNLVVLSHNEIPPQVKLVSLGEVA